MTQETQEQQDRRLAHADSLPKELVELETEFTDWWLKDHDFTPTFADAIEWARDKHKAELLDKACDAYCRVCGHYPHKVPTHICRQDCDYYMKFRKAMIKGDNHENSDDN